MSLEQKLAAKLEALARQKGDGFVGLFSWFNKYLGHYIDKSFSEFHHQLCAQIDDLRTKRQQRKVIIVPRGYAKSTYCTLANPLKCICEQTERYILLVADTSTMAEKYLKHIKDELETNLALREMYPDACEGPVWSAERIETKNGVCVDTLGKGQNARGRRYKQHRPTLIIVDDPQGDDDVNSPISREKDVAWFNRALLPSGDSDTNVFVVGNCIHRESIVGTLEKRQDFTAIKYSAIMHWPERMDMWEEWERLYTLGDKIGTKAFEEASGALLTEGAKVLWDAKEDIFTLMRMRADIGHAAFEAEKQNNPKDPAKSEFPEEWLSDERHEIWYDKRPDNIRYIALAYVDSATGTDSKRGDDSAIVSLFYDPENKIPYIEVNCKKRPIPVLLSDLHALDAMNRYDAIGFESNGFQSMISEEYYAKMSRPVAVIQIENYNVPKISRINRLGVWLERGFFRFKRNCAHTRKLIRQLQDHPRSTHDDAADALECITRMLTNYIGVDNPVLDASAITDDGLGDHLINDYR
jgi:hypothetical protein